MEPSQKRDPQQNHRRDMLLQIWLPLGLTGLLVLAIISLVTLSAFQGGETVSKGASVAVIYLVAGWMAAGLIQLALLVLSIRLVSKMYRGLPALGKNIRGAVQIVGQYIQQAADSAARPVIEIERAASAARAFWRALKAQTSRSKIVRD